MSAGDAARRKRGGTAGAGSCGVLAAKHEGQGRRRRHVIRQIARSRTSPPPPPRAETRVPAEPARRVCAHCLSAGRGRLPPPRGAPSVRRSHFQAKGSKAPRSPARSRTRPRRPGTWPECRVGAPRALRAEETLAAPRSAHPAGRQEEPEGGRSGARSGGRGSPYVTGQQAAGSAQRRALITAEVPRARREPRGLRAAGLAGTTSALRQTSATADLRARAGGRARQCRSGRPRAQLSGSGRVPPQPTRSLLAWGAGMSLAEGSLGASPQGTLDMRGGAPRPGLGGGGRRDSPRTQSRDMAATLRPVRAAAASSCCCCCRPAPAVSSSCPRAGERPLGTRTRHQRSGGGEDPATRQGDARGRAGPGTRLGQWPPRGVAGAGGAPVPGATPTGPLGHAPGRPRARAYWRPAPPLTSPWVPGPARESRPVGGSGMPAARPAAPRRRPPRGIAPARPVRGSEAPGQGRAGKSFRGGRRSRQKPPLVRWPSRCPGRPPPAATPCPWQSEAACCPRAPPPPPQEDPGLPLGLRLVKRKRPVFQQRTERPPAPRPASLAKNLPSTLGLDTRPLRWAPPA